MALVSISEAAKLVGKDRKTIYRDIKTGRVSATVGETGSKVIDIAELERVYGKSSHNRDSLKESQTPQNTTPQSVYQDMLKMARLEVEKERLLELLEEKDKQIADKEKHIEDLRSTLRVIEHKEASKPWWKVWG